MPIRGPAMGLGLSMRNFFPAEANGGAAALRPAVPHLLVVSARSIWRPTWDFHKFLLVGHLDGPSRQVPGGQFAEVAGICKWAWHLPTASAKSSESLMSHLVGP